MRLSKIVGFKQHTVFVKIKGNIYNCQDALFYFGCSSIGLSHKFKHN